MCMEESRNYVCRRCYSMAKIPRTHLIDTFFIKQGV